MAHESAGFSRLPEHVLEPKSVLVNSTTPMRDRMQQKIREHMGKQQHEKVNADPGPRFDGDFRIPGAVTFVAPYAMVHGIS
jgi:hypothetical protein